MPELMTLSVLILDWACPKQNSSFHFRPNVNENSSNGVFKMKRKIHLNSYCIRSRKQQRANSITLKTAQRNTSKVQWYLLGTMQCTIPYTLCLVLVSSTRQQLYLHVFANSRSLRVEGDVNAFIVPVLYSKC